MDGSKSIRAGESLSGNYFVVSGRNRRKKTESFEVYKKILQSDIKRKFAEISGKINPDSI
jgi:hypothetical protein